MSSIVASISKRLSVFEGGEKKLPKYRQLSETILTMIDEGRLKPGDRLPAEAALAQELPFSLGTIQQALRNLSGLGIVKRTQRRGTEIADRSQEIFDLWQFRFIDEDDNSILPVFSRVIKIDRVHQQGAWSRFLGGEDHYVRIVREIDVGDKFQAISCFYLLGSQFSPILDLSPDALEGVHLSAVIQRMFDMPTVRTNNRVVCCVIPDQICLRLDLPSGARGLICQILGFGPKDQPLSFQQTYIPADSAPMEFREFKPTWSS